MKPFGVQGNPKFSNNIKSSFTQIEHETHRNDIPVQSVTKMQFADIDPLNVRKVKG